MKQLPSIFAKWRGALVGALVAIIAGFMFLWFPQFDSLVNLSYDLGFLFRGVQKPDGVVIVYMDDDTHEKLHAGYYDRWDRSLHARLIKRLGDMHAKAIAFDVLFSDRTTPEADQALVSAAKANGKVVASARMAAVVHQGEIIGRKLSPPFQELRSVTRMGAVEEAESDKTIRRHYSNRLYNEPSLSWRVAELLSARALPEPFAERWLNYYGPPGTIENVSYYEALEEGSKLSAVLSNKVIFVGARYDVGFTGGKGTDDFATPYTRWTGRRSPGVEVNATAFLNLTRGDWLKRLSPVIETGLILAAGLLFGAGLPFLRPIWAVAAGVLGAIAIAVLCILTQWQTSIFFPWIIVCGAQIPLAVGWAVLIHTCFLQQEKRSLEQMVAILSRGNMKAEESTEEQPAFRKLRETMAPDSPVREALSAAGNQQATPDGPAIPDHELIRCIGKGGYGEVWLARNVLGSYNAVKILYRLNFKDSRPLEREFNGLKKFTPISRGHPNFVHVLHVGKHAVPEYIYYVMELADDVAQPNVVDPASYRARTLAHDLQNRRKFSLAEGLQIAIPLAQALEFLHQHQLIHRDIKPANILFVNGVPKLADVGLVTDIESPGSSITYVGTPGRIPPEGPGSPAGDIFSFGKLLYEIGVGLPMERFPELPTTLVEAPDEAGFMLLNRIILKACDMNVRHRYQSATELVADLMDLQNKTCSISK
ncbi:MAG: c-type lectin fold [Verrucomicrobiales bacterium]|nr:c-type lectin fold [Verrucomicrobiales bacterium]